MFALKAVGLAWSLVAALVGQAPVHPPAERRFMPGDRMQIVCLEDSGLCVTRVVGQDGAIAVPGLGSVGVATHPADWVARRISDLLIDSGVLDRATISIRPLFTRGAPIEVGGAVAHFLLIRVQQTAQLSRILRTADPTATADLAQITLSRGDGSSIAVDSTRQDPELRDGDRIYVPTVAGGGDVNVLGGVSNPSAVRFKRGMTLGDAIAEAGGLAAHGNAREIVVEIHGEPVPAALPEDKDMPLQAGETVRISLKAARGVVSVLGHVARAGLIDYAPGMTATQAIRAAGGTVGAQPDDDVIVRTVLGKTRRSVRLSLAFIAAKRIPDPVLAADDVVEVVGHKEKGGP